MASFKGFEEKLINIFNEAGSNNLNDDDSLFSQKYDPLLPQAVQLAIESGQISVAIVQRHLKIGYARSGRIIDEMERYGIIGSHKGAKPRDVLINRAQWLEMKKSIQRS